MLKKLKYCLLMVICCLALFACSKDEEKDDDKSDSKPKKLENIFADISLDGNKLKTVYGTIEIGDYKEFQVVNSDVKVTTSAIESTKKSLLQTAGAAKVDEEYINNYCKWFGINNEEEFNKYVEDLIYTVNAYSTVSEDVSKKFNVVEYNQDQYDIVKAEKKEYYEALIKQNGFESIEAYCEYSKMSLETFETYFYEVEGTLKNRMINLAIAHLEGIELSDEVYNKALDELAFQNSLKNKEEFISNVGDEKEDLQLAALETLIWKWFAENVKVVEDMDVEKEVVNQVAGPQKGDTVAEINVKDYGVIKIRLFSNLIPKASENFATHSKDGYYDGLTFHRIIDEFMIQGGDPNGNGTGGESIWKKPFEDEFSIQLLPIRGALCMANSGSDTNGSQFFIVQSSQYTESDAANWLEMGVAEELVNYYKENGGYGSLYKNYTIFGQVYEGMDIVDKIAEVKTGENSKPETDVVIEKISISTFGD